MGQRSAKRERRPAATLPVARVYVDVPLAHLDRTFDYQVSEQLDAAAVPGCRVRVRFAGQLVDGYLIERADTTEHTGRLAYLERVTSSEPVLTADLAELARAVADRYGGTMVDVLRLAIPPRHARVEAEPPVPAVPPVPVHGVPPVPAESPAHAVPPVPAHAVPPPATAWHAYTHGQALLTALAKAAPARAVWQACPGEQWPTRLAEAAAVVAATGRGTVLVVPDYRDIARLHEACARLCGEHAVVALSAEDRKSVV